MKNLLKVLALGLVMFFIGCGDDSGKKTAANAPEASKEVVYKVGSSADYPPFEYLDDKNQIVGFEIDLLNEITKKTGIKFDVANMSFGWANTSFKNEQDRYRDKRYECD